jgi:uncharacterized membrane protein
MRTREALWERLAAADLVSGRMPPESPEAGAWYVKAMIAISAWIASLLILLFLGISLMRVLTSPGRMISVGAIVCVAAVAVLYVRKDNLFLSQLAVATSLAGQALIGIGLFDRQWGGTAPWFAFAVVEGLLAVAAPNCVHRFLATLFAAWAVRFGLAQLHVAPLFLPLGAAAFVFAARAELRSAWAGWAAETGGLALAALFTIPVAFGEIFWFPAKAAAVLAGTPWIAIAALCLVLVWAIAAIVRDNGVALSSRTAVVAFATAIAVSFAARPVPGLIVALIVMVSAYAQGRRALCGLGLAGIVAALCHYYYALDASLLAKSAALLASGIVLLVAGFAVRRGLAEEDAHA